ncbi:MAG: hypothetical protein GEU78_08045 [Actinobacteria bacterium]|nr:hypothetical protein [Actinomycetota bacterium]
MGVEIDRMEAKIDRLEAQVKIMNDALIRIGNHPNKSTDAAQKIQAIARAALAVAGWDTKSTP